jgi:hypothetical protein
VVFRGAALCHPADDAPGGAALGIGLVAASAPLAERSNTVKIHCTIDYVHLENARGQQIPGVWATCKVAAQAVVALARIGFFNGQERHWNLYRPCPPSLILECAERVNCPKGGEGTKESGGTEEYAWLVWSRKKPQWRRCGGVISHSFRRPELGTWWHAPNGTILDWLEAKLRLPQTRSVA